MNQWQQPRITNIVLPKSAKRTTKNIVEKVQLDALEIAGDERLTEIAIDAIARLDAQRVLKARTNEGNALMYELEASFASRTGRKIANRNSPLGGL